jgi:hypothetical protein
MGFPLVVLGEGVDWSGCDLIGIGDFHQGISGFSTDKFSLAPYNTNNSDSEAAETGWD